MMSSFSYLSTSMLMVVFASSVVLPSLAKTEAMAPSEQMAETHFSVDINREAILKVGHAVAKWQLEHFENMPSSSFPESWLNAALYVGMMDWAEATQDKKYDDWLMKRFQKQKWQPAPRMYHADDIAVSQTYLDMYRKYNKPVMFWPTQARTEWVINHPSTNSLDLNYGKPSTLERWSWCDALFMAPPVYARMYALTQNKQFMDFAHREFLATYEKLFDKEERLFFRDSSYFQKREANGRKIFWGRGNGWVVAGLVEMLKELPENDTEFRPYYKELFVRLCTRLVELQCPDGYWRASLLDPDSYPAPETSGTGFISYGLAYGISEGILPRDQFMPALQKSWKALVNSVNPQGQLYWVQPVGASPKKVTKEHTEVYGVGGFLMTASEILRLAPTK